MIWEEAVNDDVVSNSQPAGLYMYTTDSSFNMIAMSRYMGDGMVITPPIRQLVRSNLGNASGNASSATGNPVNLELFSPTNLTSMATGLNVIADDTS